MAKREEFPTISLQEHVKNILAVSCDCEKCQRVDALVEAVSARLVTARAVTGGTIEDFGVVILLEAAAHVEAALNLLSYYATDADHTTHAELFERMTTRIFQKQLSQFQFFDPNATMTSIADPPKGKGPH